MREWTEYDPAGQRDESLESAHIKDYVQTITSFTDAEVPIGKISFLFRKFHFIRRKCDIYTAIIAVLDNGKFNSFIPTRKCKVSCQLETVNISEPIC
jgi:hypothetical protein